MTTHVLTPELFHQQIHSDIDKPVKDFRIKRNATRKRYLRKTSRAHSAPWAKATVNLTKKTIQAQVYLNFKQNKLSDSDYRKLTTLARNGISRYWSQQIYIGEHKFSVKVQALHCNANSMIPVDLHIEADPDKYARSMNPAFMGVDARFIYNKGFFPNSDMADNDFKLVAAHEFGHSVLMRAGGIPLSWGHKGSTNSITQSVKPSTPGYPKNGPIDLMKYYDWDKSRIQFHRRISDTTAMEIDVKRLIWAARIKWTP